MKINSYIIGVTHTTSGRFMIGIFGASMIPHRIGGGLYGPIRIDDKDGLLSKRFLEKFFKSYLENDMAKTLAFFDCNGGTNFEISFSNIVRNMYIVGFIL